MRGIRSMYLRAVVVLLIITVGAYAFGAGTSKSVVEVVQTQTDNSTYSFGEGRFMIDGKVPGGFTEFKFLYLDGGSMKLSPDRKRMISDSSASLKGELYGRLKFKIKKATMEGDALSFETQVVRGISFQFSGTVFNARQPDDPNAEFGIKGRLSKWVNGKQVAEAQVKFFYLEPED